MTNEVYANGRELSCKKGDGKSICAFPDVCWTPPDKVPPTPTGIPVPYPNTAFSCDTSKGSKKVKISGKEVMLKNKSCYKKSIGNEAGAAQLKGLVTTKNRGKVYFAMWSMDVKYEGENVVRALDLTTPNHGSAPPNGPPTVDVDGASPPAIDECIHSNIKRDPPKDENETNLQMRRGAQKKKIRKQEDQINRVLDKAIAAEANGQNSKANELFNQAAELDEKLKGDRFEEKVADETDAKEVSVKIICNDCKKTIAEFDVVTREGVVKECKASWNQVKESQFKREQKLAQRADIFGPGTKVHIAVPNGERGRLDRKFKDKANASGNIQEH